MTMKTIDAIRAILSEIDPQHIDANRDAFFQLRDLAVAYDSLTPDWSKLPDWADWYAIDANGDAYAYAYKPYNRPEMSEWETAGRQIIKIPSGLSTWNVSGMVSTGGIVFGRDRKTSKGDESVNT